MLDNLRSIAKKYEQYKFYANLNDAWTMEYDFMPTRLFFWHCRKSFKKAFIFITTYQYVPECYSSSMFNLVVPWPVVTCKYIWHVSRPEDYLAFQVVRQTTCAACKSQEGLLPGQTILSIPHYFVF